MTSITPWINQGNIEDEIEQVLEHTMVGIHVSCPIYFFCRIEKSINHNVVAKEYQACQETSECIQLKTLLLDCCNSFSVFA